MTEEDPRQRWQSPLPLYAGLHARYHYTLDMAADKSNHLCEAYLTREDDALAFDFGQLDAGEVRAWCNPPFRQVRHFVDAQIRMMAQGHFSTLLCLAGMNSKWFARAAPSAQLWTFSARVQYTPVEGVKASSAARDSVFLVFDPARPEIHGTLGGILDPKTAGVLWSKT